MSDESWKQVTAGIGLVARSGFAEWIETSLRFVAVDEGDVEAAIAVDDPKFGRLIRWITFSAGCEYLVKGACLLHGKPISSTARAVRPPQAGETLDAWVQLVSDNNPSIHVPKLSFGTLGGLLDHAASIPAGVDQQRLTRGALRFLASTIRNRDAHRFEEGVRQSHFWAVKDLFVPTLNEMLASLDQQELGLRVL